MDLDNHKVAVIIPAYNEESRISSVLDVVTAVDKVDEIIVVDDGSEDGTYDVAARYPVKIIRFDSNKGKGAGLKAGIGQSDADIFVFIDADLIGLKNKHIESLIEPLINDAEIDIVNGRFSGGRLSTNLSQRIAPTLNSQRALRRTFLNKLPDFSKSRFGVETIMTKQAERSDSKTFDVNLDGVSQYLKEEKLGFIKGVASRLSMYRDIIKHRYSRRHQ